MSCDSNSTFRLFSVSSYSNEYDYEEFQKDQKTVDAVSMNLLVIGEAAKHVPDTIKNKYDAIPWYKLRGLRNVIAHEYDRVDLSMVWLVAKKDLPLLLPKLEQLYKNVEEEKRK
ncbi:DUF86 domain-containing protein [bacterium]|nr:DUF86 domain-containing protein [bacterium]